MERRRLQAGDLAIDFSLPDLESNTPRALSEWRGKAVVLLFYRGPWCGVCQQHLGRVRKRYVEIRENGGEVVAVFPGKPEYLRPYYLERKIPFPMLADENSTVIGAYDVRNHWAFLHRGIPHPAAYVIDCNGIVRFADVRRQHFFRVPVGALVAKVDELALKTKSKRVEVASPPARATQA
jgi:peroxiredoxin